MDHLLTGQSAVEGRRPMDQAVKNLGSAINGYIFASFMQYCNDAMDKS